MNFANCRARQEGFTLMEMMIVVAIVGILAAIALPAYNEQIRRSRILDGTTKLGDFRSQMEKYFLDWRTYRTVPAAGNACGVPDPAPGGGDAFQITCHAPERHDLHHNRHGYRGQGHDWICLRCRPDQFEAKLSVRSSRGLDDAGSQRLLGDPQGRQLPMSMRRPSGFTLIELLVALAIAGILLVLALPSYRAGWPTRMSRNAASSVADGLRYAQGEAVKRNQNVEFVLGAAGWTVQLVRRHRASNR